MHVRKDIEEKVSGNIYMSDALGRGFTKSLEFLPRNTQGIIDFEKIFSLEGVYISNVYRRPNQNAAITPDKGMKDAARANKL